MNLANNNPSLDYSEDGGISPTETLDCNPANDGSSPNSIHNNSIPSLSASTYEI